MPTAPSTVRLHEPAPIRRRNHEIRKHYHNKAWEQTKKAIKSQQPLCVHCLAEGRVTLAEDVDHIIPHRDQSEGFYDQTNLQGLCKRCHAIKTRRGQ